MNTTDVVDPEAQAALAWWAVTAIATVTAMAVGTCVCACKGKNKAKVLEGDLRTITYGSNIPVAVGFGAQTVAAPHWTAGTNVNDGDGSTRPGAYLIAGKGGSSVVRVTVRITRSENVSATATLEGQLGGLTFRAANVSTAVGERDVDAQITALPGVIRRIAGNAQWTLTPADGPALDLGSTRLEMFFLLAPPDGCYTDDLAGKRNKCFRKSGVWVEALRFLCGPVGLDGIGNAVAATATITQYCHGHHGMTYASKSYHHQDVFPAQGYPYNAFKLKDYLLKTVGKANCSDQAAAVCALSCAVGSPAIMLVLEPFGYIKATNLMGIANCNNPTPGGDGELPTTVTDEMNWVAKRWGFGTHVFCELEDLIFDACAGPHVGTENRAQYIVASIDVEAHTFVQKIRELERAQVKKKMGPSKYVPKSERGAAKEKEKEQEEKALRIELRAPEEPGKAAKIEPFVIITEVL